MTFTSRPFDISCSTREFHDRDEKNPRWPASSNKPRRGKIRDFSSAMFWSRSPFSCSFSFSISLSSKDVPRRRLVAEDVTPGFTRVFAGISKKSVNPSEKFVMLRSSSSSSRDRCGKFMDTRVTCVYVRAR